MINKIQIKICLGSSCFSRGNKELIKIVQKYIESNNLESKVAFSGDHCTSNCLEGPNLRIDGKLISQVSIDNVQEILDENLKLL